jgi:hypothetical protein
MTSITPPSRATLRKYGLTADEWRALLERQGGVCAVCERVPPSGILCVDHYHVRGWKKMKPADRKKYIRCLACHFCNRRLLAKGITTERARNVFKVLLAFDQQLAANDNAVAPDDWAESQHDDKGGE